MKRIFAVMSGKGGVGKTTLSAALAEYYARQGYRTVLVDCDIGLRCADQVLNLQDRVVFDLGDILEERCTLGQALVKTAFLPSLSLLAAPQLMNPSDVKAKEMNKLTARLSKSHDIVILDAPAGVGRGLKNVLGVEAEMLIAVNPDDVCIRDAEKLGSMLAQQGEMHPGLIINRADKTLIRKGLMLPPERIAQILDMPLMGVIPDSPAVYRALLQHQTALHCDDAGVKKSIEILGQRLLGKDVPLPSYEARRMLRFFRWGGDAQA